MTEQLTKAELPVLFAEMRAELSVQCADFSETVEHRRHAQRIASTLRGAIIDLIRQKCNEIDLTGSVSVGLSKHGIDHVWIHNSLHGLKPTFWLNKITIKLSRDRSCRVDVTARTDPQYSTENANTIVGFVEALDGELTCRVS